jgi:hypothetical protein
VNNQLRFFNIHVLLPPSHDVLASVPPPLLIAGSHHKFMLNKRTHPIVRTDDAFPIGTVNVLDLEAVSGGHALVFFFYHFMIH